MSTTPQFSLSLANFYMHPISAAKTKIVSQLICNLNQMFQKLKTTHTSSVIRTHALNRGEDLKSSAVDHCAILALLFVVSI